MDGVAWVVFEDGDGFRSGGLGHKYCLVVESGSENSSQHG